MKPAALTHHGIQRGKERAGLDKRALEKTAAKAREDGLVAGDCSGRLRRYMDKMLIEHKGAKCHIHGNHIYCFRGDVLITVLDLPHEHRKAALSAGKKREAGGGKREAECGRREAECGRREAEGGKRKAESEKSK